MDAWIAHAKSIQEDIDRSRKLASSIVRQAEADDERLEGIQERETYVEFMEKEVAFNDQLLSALKALQAVQDRLVKVEETASHGMIVDSLFSLDGMVVFLDSTSVADSVFRILEISGRIAFGAEYHSSCTTTR